VPNFNSGSIGVLNIDQAGNVTFGGTVASEAGFAQAHAIAFSPDGSHAYVELSAGIVAVLNINSDHQVSDSGVRISLGGSQIPPYYGVDAIATDAAGYVLVHVPLGDTGGFVAVIDPLTNQVVARIPIPNDVSGGGIAAIP
jgi:DNA-binding beta-propeller fold protein YncE